MPKIKFYYMYELDTIYYINAQSEVMFFSSITGDERASSFLADQVLEKPYLFEYIGSL